jgi:hypothetical protein
MNWRGFSPELFETRDKIAKSGRDHVDYVMPER